MEAGEFTGVTAAFLWGVTGAFRRKMHVVTGKTYTFHRISARDQEGVVTVCSAMVSQLTSNPPPLPAPSHFHIPTPPRTNSCTCCILYTCNTLYMWQIIAVLQLWNFKNWMMWLTTLDDLEQYQCRNVKGLEILETVSRSGLMNCNYYPHNNPNHSLKYSHYPLHASPLSLQL